MRERNREMRRRRHRYKKRKKLLAKLSATPSEGARREIETKIRKTYPKHTVEV